MSRRALNRVCTRTTQPCRGITPPEVAVVLLIFSILLLLVLFSLPRQRENARMVGCQKNLMQIGIALAMYERLEGRLPMVPSLDSPLAKTRGPLKSLLETLGLPDFNEMNDHSKPPPSRPGSVPTERPIPGLLCQSDPYLSGSGDHLAPTSYRATAGDRPLGENGGFAPTRLVSTLDLENGDGRSFTAAFSERFVGSSQQPTSPTLNYRKTTASLVNSECPPDSLSRAMTDAGASWFESSWRSTLYQHGMTPNATPSCISADGLSAMMGASSAHAGGVNVLKFDGSVQTFRPTVDLQVWKSLATTQSTTLPPQMPTPIDDPSPEKSPEQTAGKRP